MRHYWTLEEYAVIDPDQVPKMLPSFAKSHPHKYSSLNKAVKELRSAKHELYCLRGITAFIMAVPSLLFILSIVKGEAVKGDEMSLWDVLGYTVFYGVVFLPTFLCGIVSSKCRVDDAKANLEKELNGWDPTLFKALYKMIIQ